MNQLGWRKKLLTLLHLLYLAGELGSNIANGS